MNIKVSNVLALSLQLKQILKISFINSWLLLIVLNPPKFLPSVLCSTVNHGPTWLLERKVVVSSIISLLFLDPCNFCAFLNLFSSSEDRSPSVSFRLCMVFISFVRHFLSPLNVFLNCFLGGKEHYCRYMIMF